MAVLKNLGFVKEAQFFPCAPESPILVIEAAAKAGAITLMQAATFSCLDILRLRAGISPWHARGMKALVKGAIPGEQQDQAGKVLKFLIPLEKILFFWFVVDLTTGFFANWASLMFKLGACGNHPNDSTAAGPAVSFATAGNDHFWEIAYNLVWVGPRRGGSIDFFVEKGQQFQVSFSLTVRPLFHNQPVGNLQTRLRLVNSADFAITGAPEQPDWIGNPIKAQLMARSHKPAPRLQHWRFEARADKPCTALGGSCALTISDRPIFPSEIIPVNCLGDGPPHLNIQ